MQMKSYSILFVLFLFLTLLLCDASKLVQKDSFKNKYDSTILVSTIDGYLSAIDAASGRVKWQYKEGPVLNAPKTLQQDFSYIPDPRTGALYTIVDKQLNKLPFTIPHLVTISPCKSSNGILYSGYKKDVWIAINPDTGIHRKTAEPQNINSCPVENHPENVFIGRTEYKVTMTDTKKPKRLWNATFVDYSSHLLPPDIDYPFQHFHSSSSQDGRIITFDNTTKQILWKIDLKSTIVNMYLLKHDGMHKLPTTAVGAKTFDTIEEDASAFISYNWNEEYLGSEARSMSDNKNLFQTLFIGDSEFGVYALNSFVETNTNFYQLKTLGPLLHDDSNQYEVFDPQVLQPRLPEYIDFYTSIYQTTSGEFLLLGHHKVPPLLMKVDVKPQSSRIPSFINFQPNEQKRQLTDESGSRPKEIAGPKSDSTWEDIFSQVWKKSPFAVIGFFGIFLGLFMTLAYYHGRMKTSFEFSSRHENSQHSRGGTRSSLNQSNATNTTIYEDITNGDFQIGKLFFNTKNVLGIGCEGTKVFKGTFDGREVAIKRVLADHMKLTTREVELLRRSDTHKNVIRYYCSEEDGNFFYIALQLCDCTLNDYVRDLAVQERFKIDAVDILRQATDGIVHLHSINIVHRDLKPQNILLSMNNKGQVTALISDFGLCKMIKLNHASISKASGFTGTEGWIAPEVQRSEFNSLTFAVDVFSLGCIFYYVISNGFHPFGDSLLRQENIRKDKYNLEYLETIKDYVAKNAIEKMIEHDPIRRPPSYAVQNHPIFWSKERQLQFFMDVSDRIEKEDEQSQLMQYLERDYFSIFKHSWVNDICPLLRNDLCRHRSYLAHTVKDLLRAMRNKKHHYRELDDDLRKSLGPIPNEFVTYFTSRFPNLLIHVYKVMSLCADESVFYTYYPAESKSFCGRVIKEEFEDGFTPAHGSPKRTLLKRQTLPSFMPQMPQQTPTRSQPNLVSASSQLPQNWRESTPTKPMDFNPSVPPPGFEPKFQLSTGEQKPKTRPRRRKNKGFAGLPTDTIHENDDSLDQND